MKRNRLIALTLGLVTIVVFGCGGAEAALPETATPEATEVSDDQKSEITETTARIWLVAPTGRYQEGWANLWEEDDSLIVEIDVAPASAVAQPAHIHEGMCTHLGGIVHRLENVIAGHSMSELPGVSLKDVAGGDMAINLHLSFADFATFTACGEIPYPDSPSAAPTDPVLPETPGAAGN